MVAFLAGFMLEMQKIILGYVLLWI